MINYLTSASCRKDKTIREITYKYYSIFSSLRQHDQSQHQSAEKYLNDLYVDELLCQIENLHQKINFYTDSLAELQTQHERTHTELEKERTVRVETERNLAKTAEKLKVLK